MSSRITEEDLLDLIEGSLPAERVGAVRAALMADAELLARVEGMRRDRGLLRTGGLPAAPRGVVERSMEQADRATLTGASARERINIAAGGRRPGGVRRALAFGLAVAATVVISSVVVTLGVKYGVRLNSHAREIPPEPVDPGPLVLDPDPGSVWVDPVVVVPESSPTIDRWTEEVIAKSGGGDEVAAVAEAASSAWLTDEAVRLSRVGRLKLVVRGSVLAASEGGSAAGTLRTRTVVVRYRTADGDEGLKRALLALAAREGAAVPGAAEAVEIGDSAAGGEIPPGAEDVLWWLRPVSEWAEMSRVRVVVERGG